MSHQTSELRKGFMSDKNLAPIVLGTDILAYSYARSFHDLYGVDTICLSSVDMKYTSTSRFITLRTIDDIDDETCLTDALVNLSIELRDTDKVPILLGSGDWYARYLSFHKEYLEGRSLTTTIGGEEYVRTINKPYVVPYIDFDLLDRLTQKEIFYRLCESVGVDYPATVNLPCAPDERIDGCVTVPFEYPVIAKPSNSAEYHYVEFEDKKKIFTVRDEDELNLIYERLCESGYTHSLVVQDNVPGDDSSLYSITVFAVGGIIRQSCVGRVVLQDRSPQAIGNPVCILGVMNDPDVPVDELLDSAQRLLKGTGYTGYANFDVKYDSRDGRYRFLEVNTRPGRNTYYVEQAGEPFVKPIVDCFVSHNEVEEKRNSRDFLFKVVPTCVIKRYVEQPLQGKALRMISEGKSGNPMFNRSDTLTHNFWSMLSYLNQIRKFKENSEVGK